MRYHNYLLNKIKHWFVHRKVTTIYYLDNNTPVFAECSRCKKSWWM